MNLSDFLRAVYQRHWALLLTLAVFLVLIASLWSVLSPFLAAALISYLVSSPANWLVRKSKGRIPYSVSAVLFVVALFLMLSGVFLLLVPVIISQIELIQTNLPKIVAGLAEKVIPWLNQYLGAGLSLDPAELRASIQSYLLSNGEGLFRGLGKLFTTGSGSVLGVTGFFTLVATAALFMAPAWPALVRGMMSLVPVHWESRLTELGGELNQTLSDYLKGVGVVVTFQGIFYATGLSLAGLNAGWAIGLLAGVLSLIPYIGLTLSLVLAVLTALLDLQGVSGVLIVVGIFVAGQLIEGFVLTPMVVGDRIGLSAIAVVFALTFFGALFGLVGVIFALPMAACFNVVLRRQLRGYRSSEFYRTLGRN